MSSIEYNDSIDTKYSKTMYSEIFISYSTIDVQLEKKTKEKKKKVKEVEDIRSKQHPAMRVRVFSLFD
jgi:hypothetical protein